MSLRKFCAYFRSPKLSCYSSLTQIISKKWGFTDVNKEEYLALKAEKRCIADGSYVQYVRPKGPLLANLRNQERAL